MALANWLALATYLDSSLAAITGINGVVHGDMTARKDYSDSQDMVAFYASLGETPKISQISMTGAAVDLDRIRLRIGITCDSTKPSAEQIMIAHYMLADWRNTEWASMDFGGTCGWKAITTIIDKSTTVPMSYFDIDIEF